MPVQEQKSGCGLYPPSEGDIVNNDTLIKILECIEASDQVMDCTIPMYHGWRVKPGTRPGDGWDSEELEGVRFDDLLLMINSIIEATARHEEEEIIENERRIAETWRKLPEPPRVPLEIAVPRDSRPLTYGTLDDHRVCSEPIPKDEAWKATIRQRLEEAHEGSHLDMVPEELIDSLISDAHLEHQDDHHHPHMVDEESPPSSSSKSSYSSDPAHTWSVASGQSAELFGTWEEKGMSREELCSLMGLTPLMYRYPLLIREGVWLVTCEPYLVVSSKTEGFLLLSHGVGGLLKHIFTEFISELVAFNERFCRMDHITRNRLLSTRDVEMQDFGAVSESWQLSELPCDWFLVTGNDLAIAMLWKFLLAFVEHHRRETEMIYTHYQDRLSTLINDWRFSPPVISHPPQAFKTLIADVKRTTNSLIPIEQLLGSSAEVWSLPVVHGVWGVTQKSIRPTLARPMHQMAQLVAQKRDKSWFIANAKFDSLIFELMKNVEELEGLYTEWDLSATEYQVRKKNLVLQMHSLVLSFDVLFGLASLIFSIGGANIFPIPDYESSRRVYRFLVWVIALAGIGGVYFIVRILLSTYEDVIRWQVSQSQLKKPTKDWKHSSQEDTTKVLRLRKTGPDDWTFVEH